MSDKATQLEKRTIDRIVREVVRRLNGETDNGIEVALDAGHRAGDRPNPSVLALDVRLITLASLRGLLDSVAELRIPCNAVVTPAVRDELNDRDIRLVHQTSTTIGSPSSEPSEVRADGGSTTRVYVSGGPSCRSAADRIAHRLGTIATLVSLGQSQPAGGNIANVLGRPHIGALADVLITDQPHQAAWLLHESRIKSARCHNAIDVRDALGCFRARVLIVDGRCGLSHELVDAIVELTHVQTSKDK